MDQVRILYSMILTAKLRKQVHILTTRFWGIPQNRKMNEELEKATRREKFLKEFPTFHKMTREDLIYIERQLRRETRKKKFLDRLDEVLKLHYENEESIEKIAKKFGLTKTRIRQIVGPFSRINEKRKK